MIITTFVYTVNVYTTFVRNNCEIG
jgi:hypothetical protein